MTVLTNNFSGGTYGVTVTTGNSGGMSGNAFDAVTVGTGSTVVYDTTHTIHESLSCMIASGSTSASANTTYSTSFGSQSTSYWRAYFYFTANPSVSVRLFNATTSGVQSVYTVSLNASGELVLTYSPTGINFATFTTAIPLNQWFRVEGFGIASSSVGQVSASLFSTADSTIATETHTSTPTLNNASTNPFSYNFGDSNSIANVGPYWVADVGLSSVGYLGPILLTGMFGYAWL